MSQVWLTEIKSFDLYLSGWAAIFTMVKRIVILLSIHSSPARLVRGGGVRPARGEADELEPAGLAPLELEADPVGSV